MATRTEGTKAARALDVSIALIRAAEAITTEIAAILETFKLSTTQFSVMELLDSKGPQRPNKLAAGILKTSSNVTFLVAALEQRGLVKRKPEPGDRRCVLVQLTSAGRALLKRALPQVARATTALLEQVSASEQEILRSVCTKIRPTLGD